MKQFHLPIRAIFYKEGEDWIAHCLEFDLVGDGRTREQALNNLTEAIMTQIDATVKYQNPDNLFTPADGKYFKMFAAGKDVAVGKLTFKPIGQVKIEGIETREYSDSDSESDSELVSA
jgi:predicted RNase H-like HicB family nuclease